MWAAYDLLVLLRAPRYVVGAEAVRAEWRRGTAERCASLRASRATRLRALYPTRQAVWLSLETERLDTICRRLETIEALIHGPTLGATGRKDGRDPGLAARLSGLPGWLTRPGSGVPDMEKAAPIELERGDELRHGGGRSRLISAGPG